MRLFLLFFVLFVTVSWVNNIIKLSECDFEAPFNCEVIHGVGLIPVVGMVTGWLDIDEGKSE